MSGIDRDGDGLVDMELGATSAAEGRLREAGKAPADVLRAMGDPGAGIGPGASVLGVAASVPTSGATGPAGCVPVSWNTSISGRLVYGCAVSALSSETYTDRKSTR